MTNNRFPKLTINSFATVMIAYETRYANENPQEFKDSLALFGNDLDSFTSAFLHDSRDNIFEEYASLFLDSESCTDAEYEEIEGKLLLFLDSNKMHDLMRSAFIRILARF